MLPLLFATTVKGQVEKQIEISAYLKHAFVQDRIKALDSINYVNFDAAGVLGTEDVVVKYVSLAEDPIGWFFLSNIKL